MCFCLHFSYLCIFSSIEKKWKFELVELMLFARHFCSYFQASLEYAIIKKMDILWQNIFFFLLDLHVILKKTLSIE